MINESEQNKLKSIKKRISKIKEGNNSYTQKLNNQSKNEENSSSSFANSMKQVITFENLSFDSKKLHLLKNPYKIILPIKTKIKKIKKSRLMNLNNYYKRTLRNDLMHKDLFSNESIIQKINFSKEERKITPKTIYMIKSSFTNSSNQTRIMNTERTSSTKELTKELINTNLSNNSRVVNYDKYNIFSCKNSMINPNIKTYSYKKENANNALSEYKTYRFLNLQEGYTNLPSIKSGSNFFVYEIKNLSREKYMNQCLKGEEKKYILYRESNDDNYKIEMNKKLENKKLFEIFNKEYNTYYNKIQMKTLKGSDYTSLLKLQIYTYKNEVNRLNIRKDKLLGKLNKYIKMKQFLIQMRNYSLDKKEYDNWMFRKSTKNVIVDYGKDIIKENRRIKVEEPKTNKKFQRRGSVNLDLNNKFNDIIIKKETDNNKPKYRKQKRVSSVKEQNPLYGSAIKEISVILNNHIANLLIYQNDLRNDLEPLKKEFYKEFTALKKNEERQNELLKLQFLILPEKKRILKDRNEFLANSLDNINYNLYNSSKYNRMNELIHNKLNNIYNTLLSNKIIDFTPMKSTIQDKIVEKILYYLRNIEKGIDALNTSKKILNNKYPDVYNDVALEIKEELKIKKLNKQKQMKLNALKKKKEKIAKNMEKSLILNRRKDYYQFGYKKVKKKKTYIKVDPYEELRYSEDQDGNGK